MSQSILTFEMNICHFPQLNFDPNPFSEVNKNRLKWAISVHFYLLFLMLTKLSPDILDRLDIFVLELEELFVPKVRLLYDRKVLLVYFQPLFWEWTWLLSTPVTFFGLSATKTANLKAVKQFLIGTLVK